MAAFTQIVEQASDILWNYLLLFLLVGTGIFFTIKLHFVQLSSFADGVRHLFKGFSLHGKAADKDGMSSFQALATAIAAQVGTGNITGCATALVSGGPGALFWTWVSAFFGMATIYAEAVLAQTYRTTVDGQVTGGPAYYIEAALHSRGLAVVFCIAMILTYAFGFNMLASYNLQSTFSGQPFYNAEITPWIIGGILALVTGWCLLGGGNRIVKVTSTLVPFMGIVYILISLLVVVLNIGQLPSVLAQIFEEAFDFKAIFAGFAGSAMMQGIRRGLYSNEAGIGSAPNAAASAMVSHPVKQGLVQMLSVFIDTLLLCTATAMMCLVSGVTPAKELQGAPWVQAALHKTLGSFGPYFIMIAMVLFAFTTLLGNCFYCDNLLTYILKKQPGKKFMTGFRLVSALVVFLGAGMEMTLLWHISDVLMGVMALINIPVILLLSNTVLKALKDYEGQIRQKKNPVFFSKNIDLKQKTDYWN